MNKEEQQQNLYQILLQRNQYNFDIIRKYRKKSNHYCKKIGQLHQQLTIDLQDTVPNHSHVLEYVVEGRVDAVGVGVVQGKDDGRSVVTQVEKCRISRGEVGDKEILKLPSINAHNHNHTTQLRDPLVCSTRRNLGVRTQISMSIVSIKDKQTKAITQINEDPAKTYSIKQSLTVPPSSAALPDPKPLLKPYLRVQHTQNFSNTSNLSLANQIHNRNHHKRESNVSTSHKALLNLQQIVFQVSNSNPPNKKMTQSKSITNKYSHGSDQKLDDGKESKKMRKYKEKLKMKDKDKEKDKIDEKENVNSSTTQNRQEVKRLTSLEGLQNLANSLGHGTSSNNANISSISLSALTCSLTQKGPKTIIQQSCNNPPDPPEKPPKLTQILPHIRKIKQLRINLHKIIRKDAPNPPSNINLNDSTSHNYSFSLSGINSNVANTSSCGQAEMQITNKMFKIESVPVHQIRWM